MCYLLFVLATCASSITATASRAGLLLPLTPSAAESPSVALHRSLHNIHYFLMNSVEPSSRQTYQSGWNHWCTYTASVGTDSLMRFIPPYFYSPENATHVGLWSFHECVFGGFLQYLAVEKKLAPSTVCGYTSGVQFFLLNSNFDIRVLETSPMIKTIKAGIHVEYRRSHPRAGRATLPFTGDMIRYAYYTMFAGDSVSDKAIGTAMVLAFVCLLRVSEYLPTVAGRPSRHFMRSMDVKFMVTTPGLLSKFFLACDVYQVPLSRLSGVVIFVRSAKNDPSGVGYSLPYDKTTSPLDLTTVLYRWCVLARPTASSPMMSTGQWVLNYTYLSKCCKRLAVQFGMNPKHFRPHSIRYGGASMLAAAGVPDSQIMLIGRWKSSAFLRYIRLAVQSYTNALHAIVDTSSMTAADLRLRYAFAAAT